MHLAIVAARAGQTTRPVCHRVGLVLEGEIRPNPQAKRATREVERSLDGSRTAPERGGSLFRAQAVHAPALDDGALARRELGNQRNQQRISCRRCRAIVGGRLN